MKLKQINFAITEEDDKKLQLIKISNLLSSKKDTLIFLIRNYKLKKDYFDDV